MPSFTKIRPVGAELIHADKKTREGNTRFSLLSERSEEG
jgi:hypothetical protein